MGLQGRQRDDAALRRVAHSEGIDGRRLAVRPRGARAVLRQGRVRDRRVGQGRATSRARSIARGNIFEGPRSARVPDAAAARHRLHRHDGDAAREARMASVPRTGRDQHAQRIRTGRAARITASARAAAATSTRRARRRSPRSRRRRRPSASTVVTEAHVTTIEVDANGRVSGVNYVKGGTEYLPAGERRAAGELRLRERAAAAAVEVEGVSERALEQSRAGRPALLQPQPDRQRHRALPGASEQLVRPAGAGRRRRRLGRRQLRSLRASISSAAAICGSTRIGGRSAPPA